ncbi:MAG: DegT/DnrJ/EryC1/StrS family aminotransferase [Dehalococcoidia bacterium]|nr:MAG: DegT/DnrJ/EryC1/StrS family aminotransferase [Dehalococcoidia bacterium]
MAYKVPFVDFPKQYRTLEQELLAAIKDVLTHGDLILREEVRRFEHNMANFVGVRYAVGVNSCTDAMYFSLLAAGVGPGDEVITVAHTFVATVADIVHCGATPILVDVGDDYNMNVDLVEAAITPRTKAIMPVHLNGRVCDMEKLMKIASQHNLVVIEDAAQALGATFDGTKAGSFGTTGCFSFYPAKSLGAAGDAGIVVTNSREIADKIRLYRDHGRQTKDDLAGFGFNSRLDNLQAAILNVKFKHLPRWIERRRELAKLYHQGLSDLPELKLPPPPQSDDRYFDVYQNYVVRSQERDKLVAHLRESGIEILISWPKPMHHQKALGLNHFHLPRTEQISREVLSLPLIPEIGNEQVEYVIERIGNFFVKREV